MPILPDAHFGDAQEPPIDWRGPKAVDDSVDDDSELTPTPADTVALLGFDPADGTNTVHAASRARHGANTAG